ncbi:hypothetical protein [Promicromonospora sp. NPDC060271]|uniref:hypothetical protein n=1 Tax=Promicromonospora sp. NPDC060271 TaxID=3347089 RepID=UPI00365276F7
MSGTAQGSRDPAEARRLAHNSTVLALIFLGLAAVTWFGWWNAQVNHIEGPRPRGFTEGDPFPWFVVCPLAGLGLWFVVTTIRRWARYFRRPAARS